ncbi:hypothetical protein AB0E08_07200 [Streptomyces sp. NPDC048281]|uniref:hypothetical protein n=1 Tax=Streptomyces sp. NPDC048281 TaxID=3154715 RepID=UPI003418095B
MAYTDDQLAGEIRVTEFAPGSDGKPVLPSARGPLGSRLYKALVKEGELHSSLGPAAQEALRGKGFDLARVDDGRVGLHPDTHRDSGGRGGPEALTTDDQLAAASPGPGYSFAGFVRDNLPLAQPDGSEHAESHTSGTGGYNYRIADMVRNLSLAQPDGSEHAESHTPDTGTGTGYGYGFAGFVRDNLPLAQPDGSEHAESHTSGTGGYNYRIADMVRNLSLAQPDGSEHAESHTPDTGTGTGYGYGFAGFVRDNLPLAQPDGSEHAESHTPGTGYGYGYGFAGFVRDNLPPAQPDGSGPAAADTKYVAPDTRPKRARRP